MNAEDLMNAEELEALKELREFQSSQSQKTADEDFLVCECKCVSVGDIREALKTGKIKQVDLNYLKKHLGLGSGCSSCLKDFNSWKSKIF